MDFKISCMNKYIHTELSRLFYSPLWSTERLGWPLQHCFPDGQQRHCLIRAGEKSFHRRPCNGRLWVAVSVWILLASSPSTENHEQPQLWACGIQVFFILTLCFEHDLLQLQNRQSCEVGPQARGESSKLLPSVKQNKTKKILTDQDPIDNHYSECIASCGLCNIAPGSPARWCDH